MLLRGTARPRSRPRGGVGRPVTCGLRRVEGCEIGTISSAAAPCRPTSGSARGQPTTCTLADVRYAASEGSPPQAGRPTRGVAPIPHHWRTCKITRHHTSCTNGLHRADSLNAAILDPLTSGQARPNAPLQRRRSSSGGTRSRARRSTIPLPRHAPECAGSGRAGRGRASRKASGRAYVKGTSADHSRRVHDSSAPLTGR
jgi:hypothetical protein